METKTTKTNSIIISVARLLTLTLIFWGAVMAILGYPDDHLSNLQWLAALVGSKLLGIAAMIVACRLYAKWRHTDPILSWIHNVIISSNDIDGGPGLCR